MITYFNIKFVSCCFWSRERALGLVITLIYACGSTNVCTKYTK